MYVHNHANWSMDQFRDRKHINIGSENGGESEMNAGAFGLRSNLKTVSLL